MMSHAERRESEGTLSLRRRSASLGLKHPSVAMPWRIAQLSKLFSVGEVGRCGCDFFVANHTAEIFSANAWTRLRWAQPGHGQDSDILSHSDVLGPSRITIN